MYRQRRITARAEDIAAIVARHRRITEGDRYCTAQELVWILEDPLGAIGRHESEKIEELAWDDVRASVPKRVKKAVRPFLRWFNGFVDGSMEFRDAEQAAGWPSVASSPYIKARQVHRACARLNITTTELMNALHVFDTVYSARVGDGGNRYYNDIHILEEGL